MTGTLTALCGLWARCSRRASCPTTKHSGYWTTLLSRRARWMARCQRCQRDWIACSSKRKRGRWATTMCGYSLTSFSAWALRGRRAQRRRYLRSRINTSGGNTTRRQTRLAAEAGVAQALPCKHSGTASSSTRTLTQRLSGLAYRRLPAISMMHDDRWQRNGKQLSTSCTLITRMQPMSRSRLSGMTSRRRKLR